MRSRYFDKLREAGVAPEEHAARAVVEHPIGGAIRQLALPLTLTPYAAATPCPARCVFCSERLEHRDATALSATLRPGPDYFYGLRRVLRDLRGLPLGLSLSGLEATDDPAWLVALIDLLAEHERQHRFEPKVLYTNGAGLARETTGAEILGRLTAFGLSRVEISRHHFRAAANDAIMRFRDDHPIASQDCFERTVRAVQERFPVRLVGVIQRGGVQDRDSLRGYLDWARALGVHDVVFRELARLGDLYRPNQTYRAIEARRVTLEDLLDEIWDLPEVEPRSSTRGYYYWGTELSWQGDMRVTFETSDYALMKSRHRSGTIFKLVFHPNGNLCGDWDPGREVLISAGSLATAEAHAILKQLAPITPLVVIGSFAAELRAPGALVRHPHDVDVVVADNLAVLDALVRTLRAEGFVVSSWGEPVEPPLDAEMLRGRFYLRAERVSPSGASLVVDITYEPAVRFEALWQAREDCDGIPVASAEHCRTLAELARHERAALTPER